MIEPDYFFLSEIAERWNMSESYLLRLGSKDKLKLHYVPKRMAMTINCNGRWVGEGMHGHHRGGLHTENINDIITYGETSINASYRVGPKKFSTTEYSPQGEELGRLIIRQSDIVITKEERDRFEIANGQSTDTEEKAEPEKLSDKNSKPEKTANKHDYDPEMQALANEIAAGYLLTHGVSPSTKGVAAIIKKRNNDPRSEKAIDRTIRAEWKKKGQ